MAIESTGNSMFILSNFNARDSRDNLTLIIREDMQCVSTLYQNHPQGYQGYMNRIFYELIYTSKVNKKS